MDINQAQKIVKKLATPNDIGIVVVDGNIINLLDIHGNPVSDQTVKELEAVIFKEEHSPAPRKWRIYAANGSKEF